MAFDYAMKDINKCLEIDPNFVRAYVRKGNCHQLMKEFHKALVAYDQGLKIDPANQECKEGKQRTMQAISMGSHAGGENDE
jgi:stress-induced-phosphoprotein 1